MTRRAPPRARQARWSCCAAAAWRPTTPTGRSAPASPSRPRTAIARARARATLARPLPAPAPPPPRPRPRPLPRSLAADTAPAPTSPLPRLGWETGTAAAARAATQTAAAVRGTPRQRMPPDRHRLWRGAQRGVQALRWGWTWSTASAWPARTPWRRPSPTTWAGAPHRASRPGDTRPGTGRRTACTPTASARPPQP